MVHICVLGRRLYQSMAKTWREQRLEARTQVRRLLQRHRGEVMKVRVVAMEWKGKNCKT